MKRFVALSHVMAVFCCLTLLSEGSPAQDTDSIAKSLGLGRDQHSLPLWEKTRVDARDQLSTNARALRDGILFVGAPKLGFGTAFVISRKHRLLATNAHVADILHKAGALTAIRNGTTDNYQVTKVWYHPGLYRLLKGQLPVRSMDPKEGAVYTHSPDMAVIKLAEEGPELPLELQLASWQEIEDLFARPLGMLGYPAHDTPEWPGLGHKPVATFHGGGYVCRLTDFNYNADVGHRALQFVQHSIASWPGFSGSPLFLPNGHVAAIHNSGKAVKNPQDSDYRTNLAYGIRIDCLWELLLYHKLDRYVTVPVKKEDLLVDRFDKPDPNTEKILAIVALNHEAQRRIAEYEYRQGLALCETALKRLPQYPDFYYTQSLACYNIYADEFNSLSNKAKFQLLQKAIESVITYIKLAPSEPDGILLLARLVGTRELDANQSVPVRDRKWTKTIQMVDILTKLLSVDNLDTWTRAGAFSKRGEFRYRLGLKQEALDDLNEAIRVDPRRWDCYHARADYWQDEGKPDLAKKDRAKADELHPSKAQFQEERFKHKIDDIFQQMEMEKAKRSGK